MSSISLGLSVCSLVASLSLAAAATTSQEAAVDAPDAAGLDWRLVDGRWESGTHPLAAEAPDGWRVLVGDALYELNEEADVGFALEGDAEGFAVVLIEAFEEELAKAQAASKLELYDDVEDGPAPREIAQGGDVRKLVATDLGPGLDGWYTAWSVGDRLVQVLVWLAEGEDPAEVEAVIGALEHPDANAQAKVRAELLATYDPESFVDGDLALREGVFWDFGSGLRIEKPRDAFWSGRIGSDTEWFSTDTVLTLEEAGLGIVTALEIAEREPGDADEALRALHDTGVEFTAGFFADEEGVLPELTSAEEALEDVAGRPALRTTITGESAWGPTTYQLVTLIAGERVLWWTFWGQPRLIEAGADALDALLTTTSLRSPAPAAREVADGVFVDRQLGFRIADAAGELTFEVEDERHGPGSVAVTVQDRGLHVFALPQADLGLTPTELLDLVGPELAPHLPAEVFGVEPVASDAEVLGLPAARLAFAGDESSADCWAIAHREILYGFVTHGGEEGARERFDLVALLDLDGNPR